MAHNPLSHYFANKHSNTLVCTSAGVIGGITKAFTTSYLLNITFDGSFTVATYAALSSVAAYFAKEGIGWVYKKLIRLIKERRQKKALQKGGKVYE
jgi:hypothetical protein